MRFGLAGCAADGRFISGLSKLKKDHTRLSTLRNISSGRGRSAIITVATLKLFPKTRGRGTALCSGCESP